ncbi:MAG TPA: winged helix DNA-binding domain-containing protein [Candidatus Saccharimonadales bacterium]|nr:winged helix DNA-binding domain-containing protein [Candidatus Saccharimonadales bacterium]
MAAIRYTKTMDLAKIRLTNQHITPNSRLNTVEDVVRSLGAVQAQDYTQALWALGLRTKNATVADVEKALEERKIIRSWSMRGTLHFILAEDARWMRELFGPLILAKITPKIWQYHGANEKMVALAQRVFTQALSGGKTLPRTNMITLLKNAGVPEDKQQSYLILAYLCQTGLLCLGATVGGKQQFALLDEWVPKPRNLAQNKALGLLARRFFTSHGPATLADFANWSGLKMADARTGLEQIKNALISETHHEAEYWFSPTGKPGAGTFLLPGYDEFVIGYKDRTPTFRHGVIKIAGSNGIFSPTTVVDGQVVGLWKRTVKKKDITIAVQPHPLLNEAKIINEANRLGTFFGVPVRIEKV